MIVLCILTLNLDFLDDGSTMYVHVYDEVPFVYTFLVGSFKIETNLL